MQYTPKNRWWEYAVGFSVGLSAFGLVAIMGFSLIGISIPLIIWLPLVLVLLLWWFLAGQFD